MAEGPGRPHSEGRSQLEADSVRVARDGGELGWVDRYQSATPFHTSQSIGRNAMDHPEKSEGGSIGIKAHKVSQLSNLIQPLPNQPTSMKGNDIQKSPGKWVS